MRPSVLKILVAALEAAVERLEASDPPKGGATEAVVQQCKTALAKAKP